MAYFIWNTTAANSTLARRFVIYLGDTT